MYNYIIKGGKRLFGEVDVSGSKNASLPILAATIISGKTCKIYNLPEIDDVKTTLEILRFLGAKIKKDKNKVIINTKQINKTEIPDELMRKLRSSVIIAGALITRFKNVKFTYPGGSDIGSRPINLHLESFEKIGIKITENCRYIECKCDKIESKNIVLEFPSVGVTENVILASVLGDHEVVISNAAREPEIIDLVNFLNKMGAKIYGAGTNAIRIKAVKNLNDVSYKIMSDRIEAATLLIAGAITGGTIKVNKINPEYIESLLEKLKETGCDISVNKDSVYLRAPQKLKAVDIKTMPYPGFPTDMQPMFSTLLTVAKGNSVISETIFENRFKYLQELKRMGIKLTEIDSKTVIIKGVRRLHHTELESTDLRGAAAMVLAGLATKGTTKVSKLGYLLRGYEGLDKKLNQLGACVLREEGD